MLEWLVGAFLLWTLFWRIFYRVTEGDWLGVPRDVESIAPQLPTDDLLMIARYHVYPDRYEEVLLRDIILEWAISLVFLYILFFTIF